MPLSWSYVVKVSEGNKENVVTGMANLSITNDEGSTKLTGGSNKPNGEQSSVCRQHALSERLAQRTTHK